MNLFVCLNVKLCGSEAVNHYVVVIIPLPKVFECTVG